MRDIVIEHNINVSEYVQVENHWSVSCDNCYKTVFGAGSSAFNLFKQDLNHNIDSHWFCSKKCVMLWNLNHGS